MQDLEANVDKFYCILNSKITNHVPVKSVSSRTFPEWYDLELRELISKKLDTHKLYNINKNKNSSEYINFKNL